MHPVTERQRHVLRLTARGWANKEIAHELLITESGVKKHLSTLMARFHVPNRLALVRVAMRAGDVAGDDPWWEHIEGDCDRFEALV